MTSLRGMSEKERIAGLKALGCNPANHPSWYTAELHIKARDELHKKHRENLKEYEPKEIPVPPQDLIAFAKLHNTTRVVIESPYSGDIPRNIAYAEACMLDSLGRGEAPFLSHLLYPRVWDDALPQVRAAGISLGHAWIVHAHFLAVYTDLGISSGMKLGIVAARQLNRQIFFRTIGGDWDASN